jgi:hypothetical protein
MSDARWVDELMPDQPQWVRDLVDEELRQRDTDNERLRGLLLRELCGCGCSSPDPIEHDRLQCRYYAAQAGASVQPPAALPHAESADDPLRAALFAVWQTLDGGRWNHEGDEESGECDEGCHACKWEALREQTRLALRDESPQPAVSLDCRTLNEIVNDLPANRRVSIAERARELIQQLAAQPPAVHVHRWVLPAPPVTASNYFCGDCGYFPGPEASTADPTSAAPTD